MFDIKSCNDFLIAFLNGYFECITGVGECSHNVDFIKDNRYWTAMSVFGGKETRQKQDTFLNLKTPAAIATL